MRIVAGRLGGRRLVAPRGSSTRPTGERVREALFAVLGARVVGAKVLDAYAGTGALGLEALSRGAARVVLVESAAPALAAIRANVESLGVQSEVEIVAGAVERAFARLQSGGPFDLVLVDPPWARSSDARSLVKKLLARGLLRGGAIVVLEHPSAEEPELEGFAVSFRRSYGDTGVSIFEPAPAAADAPVDGAAPRTSQRSE